MEESMTRIATAVFMMIFISVAFAQVQSPTPKLAPELKDWDLWVGDWTMVGTAKDTPTEPEYKVDWKMHGSRILAGYFVQVDHIWKGKGSEQHWLEILSYDPIKKIHAFSGFDNTGATWLATATFKDRTSLENGATTTADGKIIKWRVTWNISADRMTVSGSQESELDGARWTSFTVKGTKAKTPARTH
jgi:hypothetical protein